MERKEIEISEAEINNQKQYILKINAINIAKNRKYNIQTMGCALNENDSEKLAGMLEEMGYSHTETMDDANLVIFNTCCVRENAEDKVFGKLGELKNRRKIDDLIIAVGGCMNQEDHIVAKIKKSYNFVDVIFGTHTLYKFPELLFRSIDNGVKVTDVIDIDGQIFEGLPIKRNSSYSASITIMYGCNNFCTYCIVPYVRGRERSRRSEDILNEIVGLAKEGYKEVVLLGQNVNSYGKDFNDNNVSFANLLYKINEIEGIEIIKFVSPHPKDFTDDVIEAISKCEKVYNLIHLPLQSGSNNILNKMNRKYTREQFIELAGKIKNKKPDVAFTTDIIVGFPGETEQDFQDTLDVLREVKFDQVYMFIYSKRVGTIAEKMDGHIDENIKVDRLMRMKQVVTEIIEEKNKLYIGSTQKILVEGRSKNNEEMLTGRTDTNKVVIFSGSDELVGKIINVKILSDHLWFLKGEII